MKVSIIIPYVEDRGYLAEAIASCKDQDDFVLGKDYEIILQQGNYGVSKNINDGVEKAKGEFIKICADDDIMTTNCLSSLYEMAKLGFDLVCADSLRISTDEHHRGLWPSILPDTIDELAHFNSLHGGTMLYRKSKMPRWNEDMWTAEEYDVSLRMAVAGCRFGYVQEIVYCYRIWRGNKSMISRNRGDINVARAKYINDYRSQYYGNFTKIVK